MCLDKQDFRKPNDEIFRKHIGMEGLSKDIEKMKKEGIVVSPKERRMANDIQ